MRAAAVVLVGFVLFAAARPAAAQPASNQPTFVEPEPSYGWQILAVDASAMALATAVAFSSAREDFEGPPSRVETFAGTWWLLSTVTAPGVHFGHDRLAIGWTAAGVRTALPLLSSAIGAASTCVATVEDGVYQDGCENDGFTGGMLIGTAAAAGIDALLLSSPSPSPGEPRRARVWYGWQTLAVDAGGVALGAYLMNRRKPNEEGELPSRTLSVAASMYTVSSFVSPLVHVVNGHGLRGLGSFGMRAVGAPLFALGGTLGWCAATAGSGDGACSDTGMELGLLGGVLFTAAVDAFALSWEDVSELEQPARPPGMTWIPALQLVPGGTTLTLGSAF